VAGLGGTGNHGVTSRSGTDNGTATALVGAGNLTWTAPATAALVRRGEAVPPDHDVLDELLLIPSSRRPRLLVPAGRPAAAAESVRRYSQALEWHERVVRVVLAAGLRTGVLDRLVPDRLRVTVPDAERELVTSLQAEVGRVLGRAVVLSLGVGTPRANRKPVLQAISSDGEALAFVKLGDTAVTRELLRAEAGALGRLAERPPAVLRVPRALHLGEWNGIELLVQSALRTPPYLTHRRSSVPHAAMRALVSAFDAGRGPALDSPAWRRIVTAPAEVTDPARAALFAAAVTSAADRLEGVVLAQGAWHGDWTPWNMAWVRDEVRIWDWERFAEGVPVGFDALHYALAARARRRPWDEALSTTLRDASRLVAPLGVPAAEGGAVALLYLLDLCRRYLTAAAPEVGRPLRPRADGLLRFVATAAGASPAGPIPLPDWRSE
jgi:hypothetical protein